VAVVILLVHKYKEKVTRKFKSGGLHENHVVATWKLTISAFAYRHRETFRLIKIYLGIVSQLSTSKLLSSGYRNCTIQSVCKRLTTRNITRGMASRLC